MLVNQSDTSVYAAYTQCESYVVTMIQVTRELDLLLFSLVRLVQLPNTYKKSTDVFTSKTAEQVDVRTTKIVYLLTSI